MSTDDTPKRAALTSLPAIRAFVLADQTPTGAAIFTLEGVTRHFTFRVKQVRRDGEPIPCWNVKVLAGGAVDASPKWVYLGSLRSRRPGQTAFIETKGSQHGLAFESFAFFARCYLKKDKPHPALRFYHEGRCCACGRALTTPESVQRGFGPTCWEKRAG